VSIAAFDHRLLDLLRGTRQCVVDDEAIQALMGAYQSSIRRNECNERFEPLPSSLPRRRQVLTYEGTHENAYESEGSCEHRGSLDYECPAINGHHSVRMWDQSACWEAMAAASASEQLVDLVEQVGEKCAGLPFGRGWRRVWW
jgi:hypothetical protein